VTVQRQPIVSVRQLGKWYPPRGQGSAAGKRAEGGHWAARNVDFDMYPGEILGLVGESGSGKSTVAKCIAGLTRIGEGEVSFEGHTVGAAGTVAQLPRLDGVQVVYQDPHSSLNPRRTVGSILKEIIYVHRLCPRSSRRRLVDEALADVGLPHSVSGLRPAAMSGGMCQRVALARALLMRPRLLIADEAVSALDASVQAQVLNLLADARDQWGVAILCITHDLAVVNQLCDRVQVMKEGEVVEAGDTKDVLRHPQHPYTRALIAAVPSLRDFGR
jgi:ABC-type glutathione transport system ATPase component